MRHHFSLERIVLSAVVIALAWLNLYQYLIRKHMLVPEEQVVERFHKLFYEKYQRTWKSLHWLGIPSYQNPNDAWVIQEIITETKPDFIVETGTAQGGSAVLWATVLGQVNPDGRIITIDIQDKAQQAKKLPIAQEKLEFLTGSSTDPKIVEEVKGRVRDGRVLVILDSDHTKRHVLSELAAYAPLVDVGGYIIVQDTNINGHPVLPSFGPGPMEAVEEFLERNRQFEPDWSRERLLFTMHPKGYLRRVK